MQFLLRYFPEITIKGRQVRLRSTRQLERNLNAVLSFFAPRPQLTRNWDCVTIAVQDSSEETLVAIADKLARVPGIANFSLVEHAQLSAPTGAADAVLEQICAKVLAVCGERVKGKRFAVRCKRVGKHLFRSVDVERFVGAGLLASGAPAGVDLTNPELTVRIELRDEHLFIEHRRYQALGGFPLGTIDSALSLMSGGYDSCVASYLTMRRGVASHYCFFNLGGFEHEAAVREICMACWRYCGAPYPVSFVSVPFAEVLANILDVVPNSMMGVVLKRAMLRVAGKIAEDLGVSTLVTGESVSQVSSQTLPNLRVIDHATNKLVLRPLATEHKERIIAQARQMGVEELVARVPEYCGVASVSPTTCASLPAVRRAERKLDRAVFERALDQAQTTPIAKLNECMLQKPEIEILSVPLSDSIIIDLRLPRECQQHPLEAPGNSRVLEIPFYKLQGRSDSLCPRQQYLLYCNNGVISRLQAAYLKEAGLNNIKIYQPREEFKL